MHSLSHSQAQQTIWQKRAATFASTATATGDDDEGDFPRRCALWSPLSIHITNSAARHDIVAIVWDLCDYTLPTEAAAAAAATGFRNKFNIEL